jgi:hypothetical protein
MNAAVIAAAGITALTVFFLPAEGDSLSEGHARLRSRAMNAARWGPGQDAQLAPHPGRVIAAGADAAHDGARPGPGSARWPGPGRARFLTDNHVVTTIKWRRIRWP